MLRLFNSVDIDLRISGIQKVAAACLLAALLPVQGHAASALSRLPGATGSGLPQTESAAPGNSKQNTVDQERAGVAKQNSEGAASGTATQTTKKRTLPLLGSSLHVWAIFS
jgi:hypothetical protein